MTTQLAVAPGVLTPGFYLSIDLLAGAGSGSANEFKVLLIAPVNTTRDALLYPTGDLDGGITELRRGAGPDSAAVAFGTGGSGHLAAKQIYAQVPGAVVDFLGLWAFEGTAASLQFDLLGTPAVANTIYLDIAGRVMSVVWPAGTAFSDMGLVLRDAINSKIADYPVVATVAGLDDQLVLTAKDPGLYGNDIIVRMWLDHVAEGGGTEDLDFDQTIYQPLAGGAGAPDLTDVLYKAVTTEYAFILPVLSNTDVIGASGGIDAVKDHIASLNSGLNSKLQQFVVGFTSDSIAAAKTTALGATRAGNVVFGELVMCVNGRGLPGELAGREVGGWLAALPVDPAVNRIGELFSEYDGAGDLTVDTPTASQIEDALGGGVSIVSYTPQGIPQIVRPVTTHSQDDFGGADRRCLDVQFVSATYVVARDLRSAIPAQFPKAKITPDIAPGDDPPPKNVIEERDIKGFVVTRLRRWQADGVITKASLDSAIADGSLSVKVNTSDLSQVDIFLPFKIVPPLAKFGVVVNRVPS